MYQFLIPVGVLGAVLLLSGDDKKGRGGSQPLEPPKRPSHGSTPVLSPKALAATTVVQTVDGKPVRYFKHAAVSAILEVLKTWGLQTVPSQAAFAGATVGRLTPPGEPSQLQGMSAAQALWTAGGNGAVVATTTNLVAPGRTMHFAAVMPRHMITRVSPDSAWAVLIDPKRPNPTPPGGGATPGGGAPQPAPGGGGQPSPGGGAPQPAPGGGGAIPGGGTAPGVPTTPPSGGPPGQPAQPGIPGGGGHPAQPGGGQLPPGGVLPGIPANPPSPAPGFPSIPGGGGAPGAAGGLDAHLPAKMRTELQQMLSDADASPEALEQAANALEASYPMAAAALRQRAGVLRDMARLAAMRRGGTPFNVRAGDIPHRLASHYTGNGNRWRELPAANAHINMRQVTRNGVTQLDPWRGEILLPLSWEAWKKPLPPVATARVMTKPEKEADKALTEAEKNLKDKGKA